MISEIESVEAQLAMEAWRDVQNRPENDDPDSDITDLVPSLTRLLVWLSDATTVERVGLRTLVLIQIVRPDLLPATSIAQMSGTTRQNISKLAVSFRQTFGLRKSAHQAAKEAI